MKRFYTEAAATGTAAPFGVALDGRPVRTPARAALALPTAALAHAIANEWAAQADAINPRTMPLTGLANAAIDRVAPDPGSFAARLAGYAESELLAYRADGPESLVARQAERWDPWLAWAAAAHDARFRLVTGILHVTQPADTLAAITAAFAGLDPFRLVALDPIVTITGSAVLGLAVLAGKLDADAAYDLGHLDQIWQAEQWGDDPLAAAAEATRRADLAAAVRFLSLLQ
jgi:chaperone required for assembly of F1-ATPase